MAKSQDMPILLEDGLNASLDVSTGKVTISKSVGHGSWSGGYGLPITVYANTYDFLDGTGRIEFVCRACGMRWSYGITSNTDTVALIRSAAETIAFTHPETQSFGNRHWCSQCPQEERLVDGLTSRECLARYEENIRTTDRGPMPTQWLMTTAQLTAARTAWSAEIKKRQAAAREKERCQVVVDLESVDV